MSILELERTADNAILDLKPVAIRHSVNIPKKEQRPAVKKIPLELSKRPIKFSLEPVWYNRLLWRLREDSQFLRSTIQASFVLLCVWIGIEFYLFTKWGLSGEVAHYVERPPGAEGFLPISALMSLKYWIDTGIINGIHPASMFILLAIVGVSIVLKKSFCSWLCPIGTLSESLWMLGQKIFRRNLTLPRWLDYPLRSLKYLLLFYFVYAISTMTVEALRVFIYSPYNKVADIK
ncbi:MAG TPA: 4Fe-4S binding protein, partial [Bacteroidota bacterium]